MTVTESKARLGPAGFPSHTAVTVRRVRPPEPLLYGLDIETDTTTNGLDPGVAAIVAVAVSSEVEGDTVITGSEPAILLALDAHLASLEPGVIVTWNGAAFDLPVLADRARHHGVHIGLDLRWDPRAFPPGRGPLPGHLPGYSASWWRHRHLDAYRAWRELTADPDESCALKAVARREGFDPLEVDRALVHQLDAETLRRYATRDAARARRLAAGRWAAVRRFLDAEPVGQLAFGY